MNIVHVFLPMSRVGRKSALVERVYTAHSGVFSYAIFPALPHGPYSATTEKRCEGRLRDLRNLSTMQRPLRVAT